MPYTFVEDLQNPIEVLFSICLNIQIVLIPTGLI